MRRLLTLLAMTLLIGGMATAQTKSTKKSEDSFGNKVSKFFKKVKNEITYTADGLFSKEDKDLLLVDGNYYMPVYKTNLYAEADGNKLRELCRTSFAGKYPNAKIQSCTLPQNEWLSTPVKKDDNVVGYVQTMYCYVLAKDGEDGYINAKYVFVRTKDVGKSYQQDNSNWGRCLRTDVLTPAIYAELTKVKKDK